MGGVKINVQIPVAESQYPTRRGQAHAGSTSRPGPQHMTGTEALRYARSRHRVATATSTAAGASSGCCSACASR